jgi:uncharacterized protein involved in exopolysaccharide biosynthesis
MDLKDAIRIISARRVVVFAVLCVGLVAAFLGWKLSKPTYAATSSVMMDATSTAGTTVSNGSFLGSDMPSLLLGDTLLTHFIVQQHLGRVKLKDLRKAIVADISTDSAVMPITYHASTPQAAVAGANALADDLHGYYRELSTKKYDDLAAYLSTALDGEQQKIEHADERLARLVATDPYLTQSDAAMAIGAQLLALDQQRDEIAATMQSHAVAAELAGQRIGDLAGTIKSELRTADPEYSALASEVAKDKTAEDVLKAQFTDKYAGIQSLEDQITRSRGALEHEKLRAESADKGISPTYGLLLKDRDEASAIYQGDEAQLAAIEGQIESAESHLANLPNVGPQIAAIRRDRDAANAAYQILAEQRTLTLSEQAQAAALGSITVVDRATVADPSIGKLALLVPVAAFLAFVVLALALPFGIELADERLRRRVTIETLYGRPLIGRVPA